MGSRPRKSIIESKKKLTKTKLSEKNLIKAINTKVILVVAYPMNVCKFTKVELNELDLVVKRGLKKCNKKTLK